jgi:hypothetical protein
VGLYILKILGACYLASATHGIRLSSSHDWFLVANSGVALRKLPSSSKYLVDHVFVSAGRDERGVSKMELGHSIDVLYVFGWSFYCATLGLDLLQKGLLKISPHIF